MTTTQLAAFLSANLLLGLACIPLYIRAAKKRDIIDVPNERSSHTTPTPRGGGIFIAVGCMLSVALADALLPIETPLASALFIGAAVVTAIGFTDDLKPLPSLLRLGGHFLAALSFIVAILFFAADNESASALSLPVLVGALAGLAIWIVGCLNIYNFMDGIDGIATGQGLTAAAAWLAVALAGGQAGNLTTLTAAALSAALLGGLLAFLFFNWSPAKVFMGDGASGFLGFSFAALPILVAEPTPTDLWLNLNLGALILFPFLFDGTFTLIRRAIRKENVLEAHRSHLYQRWTQAGATHRKVASAYTAWAATGGVAAILVNLGILQLLAAYAIVLVPAAALLLHSRRFPK